MLFNLEADNGDSVFLYVVPDAYSEIPAIRVQSGDRELLTLEANEIRHALLIAGRHETGRCGFRLDNDLIPNLSTLDNLACYEVSTGLLVYRRTREETIPKKVLRLETSLLPQHAMDKFLINRFQHGVQGIEKFGLETSVQLFLLGSVSSVYLSGRIILTPYLPYVEDKFETIIALDDPYVALAERLLIISKMDAERGVLILGERDFIMLKSAIAFAKDLKFDSGKTLRRALRSLPPEIAVAFVNPLTRQLTCNTPDEMPRRGAVAMALDRLSTFAIVGLREDIGMLRPTLGAFLDIPAPSIPLAQPLPSVVALAEILRAEASVEALVESDLEIYTHVHNAYQTT